jgi:hypothetical protein
MQNKEKASDIDNLVFLGLNFLAILEQQKRMNEYHMSVSFELIQYTYYTAFD